VKEEPARHKDLEAFGRGQQLRYLRRGFHDLFEVVEDQEHAFVCQVIL